MKMGLARLKEIINEEARSIVEAVIGGGEDTSDEPTVEEPVGGEPAAPAAPPDSEAQPLLDLIKDFLASPAPSAESKEAVGYIPQQVSAGIAEGRDLKESGLLDIWLNQSIAKHLLRDMSDAAEAYYEKGDEGAGGNYMLIKEYVQEKLNPVIENYDWAPIPNIELWITTYDNPPAGATFRAVGQSVFKKYSTGAQVPSKTILRVESARNRGEPWSPLGVTMSV